MATQQLLQHLKQEKGMSHVQKDSSLLSYFIQTIIRISDLKKKIGHSWLTNK